QGAGHGAGLQQGYPPALTGGADSAPAGRTGATTGQLPPVRYSRQVGAFALIATFVLLGLGLLEWPLTALLEALR
ncbi:MAG: hypothetical protein WBL29_17650, partial [Burkholderiales bacterium]